MFDDDDWGSGAATSTQVTNRGDGGFGRGSSFGDKATFGRGRGRFAGKDSGGSNFNSYEDSAPKLTEQKTEFESSGWNDSATNGWNDSSSGGFGKPSDSKGFGSGFNSGSFGDKPDRSFASGGFGASGGGRPKTCFKCGEEGHMSRECPSADSSSGGFGGSGGGRPKTCFKCGEEGHMSRECPSADSSSGGFGGGKSRGCFKCGEEGHMSRDCPSGGSAGFGGGKSKSCFKCGEEGHMSRDCPSGGSQGGFGGGRPKGCFKCGEEGHMSRECPSGGDSSNRGKGCFKCGEEGHMARDCPSAGDDDKKDRPPLYIPPPPPEEEDEMFASMQRGINFNKYDAIPVEVTGVNAPKFINSFEAANLPETIAANVKRAHYDSPTPVQKFSLPIILADRDLMACAQTGSGKTAAFLLPVLTNMVRTGLASSSFSEKQLPQAIIVGPTRELVYQIYLEARKFSRGTIIRPVVAYGGTSTNYQLKELQKGCHLLIATPGRLMDFINRGKIGLSSVQYIILDEADRMLDMGFETEIRKLVDSPGMPAKNERHTLMFSATFPDEIQKLAHDFLREDFLFLTVGRIGGACSDVTQVVLQVDQGDKRNKLIELLADVADTGSRTLVFVETKRSADFLACSLCQEGYPTTSIHGDRLQQEREEALRDFKSGKCPILVATSVAARGLDIPKVEHVVNYDLPSEVDEYVHRIGRTGRCGNLGRATSFYDDSANASLARSLVKILADSIQEVPSWLEECAESAVGTSFGKDRGGFGGRDTRRGNFKGRGSGGNSGGSGFGSRQTGDYDYNDAGGFGGGGGGSNTAAAAADDDSWD